MSKIVLAISGGLDSTTLLAKLLDDGHEVVGVAFRYGSKHESYEINAMSNISSYYSNKYPNSFKFHNIINLTEIFKGMKTPFLRENSDKEIPEGNYNDDNMKDTVVPARNAIFLSVLAGIANDYEADKIAIGIHSGDHNIYPDCRPEFYKAMNEALYLATDKTVEIVAPFLDISKAEIVKIGLDLKVPYELTRTCYKDQSISCGKCGSCNERLEAFTLNGVIDPISYL